MEFYTFWRCRDNIIGMIHISGKFQVSNFKGTGVHNCPTKFVFLSIFAPAVHICPTCPYLPHLSRFFYVIIWRGTFLHKYFTCWAILDRFYKYPNQFSNYGQLSTITPPNFPRWGNYGQLSTIAPPIFLGGAIMDIEVELRNKYQTYSNNE